MPAGGGGRSPFPAARCVWPADNVILATGQFPDTSWIDAALRGQLVGDDGWLKSGRAVRTAHEKLFAAGDFAQGAMSLIDAIGHAKRCAREIDTFLCGVERLGRSGGGRAGRRARATSRAGMGRRGRPCPRGRWPSAA